MSECCEKCKEWIHDNRIEFHTWYDDSEFVEINFCPFCGKEIEK